MLTEATAGARLLVETGLPYVKPVPGMLLLLPLLPLRLPLRCVGLHDVTPITWRTAKRQHRPQLCFFFIRFKCVYMHIRVVRENRIRTKQMCMSDIHFPL